MKTRQLQNVVWKDDKYYVAQCLNIDVSSFGKTRREALANLDEALDLYFEDMEVKHVPAVQRPEIVSWSFSHV